MLFYLIIGIGIWFFFFRNKENTNTPTVERWDGISTVQPQFEGTFAFSTSNQVLILHRTNNHEYGGSLTNAGVTIGNVYAYATPTGLKGQFKSLLTSPKFEIIGNGGRYYMKQTLMTHELRRVTAIEAATITQQATSELSGNLAKSTQSGKSPNSDKIDRAFDLAENNIYNPNS